MVVTSQNNDIIGGALKNNGAARASLVLIFENISARSSAKHGEKNVPKSTLRVRHRYFFSHSTNHISLLVA